MVSLFAGNPPGIPYAGSPVVQAFTAPSIEYFAVPGGIGVLGSFGAWYSGSWKLVGPVASQPPCMSYVITLL